MSIEVSHISKYYGTQKALDDVSFSVKQGEVIGFLGPNGAGKSTMMKIITCFLPQSEGKVNVYGFDVVEQSLEVRKRVGYLPEHNPLYLDLYVKEYLHFAAGLSGMKNAQKRVAEMIDLTGLGDEQHKLIGALSKGYRQRVGLAQAMIHDPQVLILDEPTTGLDPNQIVEIRNLIKNIGQEKTILLSTHIMQEVDAMCNRVIIINKGKIVADNNTGELSDKKNAQIKINIEFDKAIDISKIMKISGVEKVQQLKNNHYEIITNPHIEIRPLLFKFAVENDLTVLTVNRMEETLENIFRTLTKE